MDDERRTAAELMRLQAGAIMEAADRLDADRFDEAAALIVACEGHVVVTGAGTSGVIARKIAATLTSTGTPAIFLHPADALHGALGIVTSDDVAVAISNSGETDELLGFLPYLEHRKVPMIALVGNLESTLAAHAAVALDAGAAREACPLNLAPTSSTSVALALGDALAMTVMSARNVTPERFALNHPSGRLGRRLTLKVDDLARADAAAMAVGPDASFFDVVGAVTSGGVGAVTVEGDDRRLVGIITDGDLRRTLHGTDAALLAGLRAADVMTANPIVVSQGMLAYDAMRLMEDRSSQIGVLPIVDALHQCVGLVRLHDMVRAGL